MAEAQSVGRAVSAPNPRPQIGLVPDDTPPEIPEKPQSARALRSTLNGQNPVALALLAVAIIGATLAGMAYMLGGVEDDLRESEARLETRIRDSEARLNSQVRDSEARTNAKLRELQDEMREIRGELLGALRGLRKDLADIRGQGTRTAPEE